MEEAEREWPLNVGSERGSRCPRDLAMRRSLATISGTVL